MWSPTSLNRLTFPCNLSFQSTGSVWSPTYSNIYAIPFFDISIHGLRVEPDDAPQAGRVVLPISIHGLRVEPDMPIGNLTSQMFAFQSTGSVWSPTIDVTEQRMAVSHFNPRAPCGARLRELVHTNYTKIFQSTGSVWSPTGKNLTDLKQEEFQSTGSVWSPTIRFCNHFKR